MNFKNHEALASAFKTISVHNEKIEELDLYSDMTEDEVDTLVQNLSEIKAISEGKTIDKWKEFSKGQQFYVEALIKEISMTDDELLTFHYKRAFSEVATEEEMREQLASVRKDRSKRPTTPVAA